MSTYTFRQSELPYVALTDDSHGHVAYELSFQKRGIAKWGGVIEKAVAWSLKPWAKPVRLDFRAYRIANRAWCELEVGQGLWGCLLSGPAPGQVVAFVVLAGGLPMPTKVDPRWVPHVKTRA